MKEKGLLSRIRPFTSRTLKSTDTEAGVSRELTTDSLTGAGLPVKATVFSKEAKKGFCTKAVAVSPSSNWTSSKRIVAMSTFPASAQWSPNPKRTKADWVVNVKAYRFHSFSTTTRLEQGKSPQVAPCDHKLNKTPGVSDLA